MKYAESFRFEFCKDEGLTFIEKLEKCRRGIFLLVLGNTEIAKIPQISAAGKNPEITDFTPAADAELLIYGSCKCIEGVPVTPEGIPTPAIITRSALELCPNPIFIINGGLRVTPHLPFLDIGGQPGRDFRKKPALENVFDSIERGKTLGEELSKTFDYLVVAESIPGGTTTALAVLIAMGVKAMGKISSSLKENPVDLKSEVIEEGMKRAKVSPGDFSQDPIKAISHFGDPMMAATLGVVSGIPSNVPILLAGGTQMTAILRVIKAMNEERLDNLAIGTTKWIVEDTSSDLTGLVKQIGSIPIIASDINFCDSRFEGLRTYDTGMVKEGVGAGGSVIHTIIRSNKRITNKMIIAKIENEYERLVSANES